MDTDSTTDMREREELIYTAVQLSRLGLNKGTAGNVSVRCQGGFLITPSGVPAEDLTPADVVAMRDDGQARGGRAPSSEWRFHAAILASRPELGAVVHTHSTYCTTLAVMGRSIPAFHYMVAVAGGEDIRCAPYATFGTEELCAAALTALDGRRACLLAQHGMIAAHATLARALTLTVEVEELARVYWQALQIGEPPVLSAAEMARVLDRFRTYGAPQPGE